MWLGKGRRKGRGHITVSNQMHIGAGNDGAEESDTVEPFVEDQFQDLQFEGTLWIM